jgi:hypothetical protein
MGFSLPKESVGYQQVNLSQKVHDFFSLQIPTTILKASIKNGTMLSKAYNVTSYQLCLSEQCLFVTSYVDQMFDNPSKVRLFCILQVADSMSMKRSAASMLSGKKPVQAAVSFVGCIFDV